MNSPGGFRACWPPGAWSGGGGGGESDHDLRGAGG